MIISFDICSSNELPREGVGLETEPDVRSQQAGDDGWFTEQVRAAPNTLDFLTEEPTLIRLLFTMRQVQQGGRVSLLSFAFPLFRFADFRFFLIPPGCSTSTSHLFSSRRVSFPPLSSDLFTSVSTSSLFIQSLRSLDRRRSQGRAKLAR